MAPLEVKAGSGEEKTVTPEEIRAAAAQAAATLMAPVQPSPADFVATAEVIEAYIEHGKLAAFALCLPEDAVQQPPEPVALVEPAPVPLLVPAPQQEEPEPQREAEVIPLAVRSAPNPKQEAARRQIEKTRKTRADAIFKQASVAKTRVHKQRLLDEAEEAELAEYPVVVKGETVTLGAYLGSLLGS